MAGEQKSRDTSSGFLGGGSGGGAVPLVNIVDRPLAKGKEEVSLSAFSFLFSEIVQYCQSHAATVMDLEQKLSDAGYGIGLRMLELLSFREKQSKKEKSLKHVLQFIRQTVWKTLFGKIADDLLKSKDKDDEYYIYDNEPITNRFIPVAKDSGFNCAAFLGGIINGVLDAAEFTCTVTTHVVTENGKQRTVFIVKCDKDVVERDRDMT